MIRYNLACSQGHEFEGWFASSEAYDKQRAAEAVECPSCGATDVSKALMAPAVSTSRKKEAVSLAANNSSEVADMLRKLRQQLTSNADYVGDRFAEEARRIHFEEVEKRGIYGEATPDEVRGLVEDGIEFHPLPTVPEDHN